MGSMGSILEFALLESAQTFLLKLASCCMAQDTGCMHFILHICLSIELFNLLIPCYVYVSISIIRIWFKGLAYFLCTG